MYSVCAFTLFLERSTGISGEAEWLTGTMLCPLIKPGTCDSSQSKVANIDGPNDDYINPKDWSRFRTPRICCERSLYRNGSTV